MKLFSALIAVSLMALGGFVSVARADNVALCAGRAGGGYDSLIKSVGNQLRAQGHTVTIINLPGSEATLNALRDGLCAYGPAQGDIYYRMTKEDPSVATAITPSVLLYNEVMTLMCSKASGVDELSDLTDKHVVIGDAFGSGSAMTWENLAAIEKEYGNGSSWIKARADNTPLDEALAAISVGQAQCAFGMGKVPIDWAREMEEKGFTLSYVYDKDINDLEFNGSSLYNPVDINKGSNAYRSYFETYIVPAILFRSGLAAKTATIEKLVKRVAAAEGAKVNTVQE